MTGKSAIIVTYVGCGIFALPLLYFLNPGDFAKNFRSFSGLFLASGLNLWALQGAVRAFLELLSDSYSEKKSGTALTLKTFFWGNLKLISLVILGFLVWRSRTNPVMTLLLGIAPIVVVPLIGGFFWSRDYYARTRF